MPRRPFVAHFVLLMSVGSVPAQEQAPSAELHPTWNRKGTEIAFCSNRAGNDDIYVLDLSDGSSRQLTDDHAADANPVWSPNGEWIAFHSNRYGNYDIFLIRPDGSGLRRLTTDGEHQMSPGWSPDSRMLVMEWVRNKKFTLETLDLGGGGLRRVSVRDGDHLTPLFSPDGTSLFYTYSPPGGNHDSDVEIFATPLDDLEVRSKLPSGTKGDSNLDFSPDGKRLVFNSIRDGNWEIYVADVGAQRARRLTWDESPEFTLEVRLIDGQPAWSPDGKRIAFVSGRSGNLDIWVMNADGEELRNLTGHWRQEAQY